MINLAAKPEPPATPTAATAAPAEGARSDAYFKGVKRVRRFSGGGGVGGSFGGHFGGRGWESAETDRLNAAHWTKATDQGLNLDLNADLPTLRARCQLELQNNPMVAGMVRTYQDAVVGENGPTLQVQSDDEQYNQALEDVLNEWWAMPDLAQMVSGVEYLRQWVGSLFPNGEYLVQLANDDEAPADQIALRLHGIAPRRLTTPWDHVQDNRFVMGVERSKQGRPIQYHIQDSDEGLLFDPRQTFTALPAAEVLHRFLVDEPGQARGVPWLASVLQVIAELREYDQQVLDAARSAAEFCVLLWTNDTRAEFLNVSESVELERRTMSTLPPGWQATQIDAKQPHTNYTEFRKERMLDIGRAFSMPLMMIRLDSREHNYSSARFDALPFWESVACVQRWISSRTLNPIVWALERQARLLGMLGRRGKPARVKLEWIWPKPKQVDPAKEAMGQQLRLENGVDSYADACAADGKDWRELAKQRKREKDYHDKLGIPYGPVQAHQVNLNDVDALIADGKGQSSGSAEGDERSAARVRARATLMAGGDANMKQGGGDA